MKSLLPIVVSKFYFNRGESPPEPILCKLHDIFNTGSPHTAHNCLGCNFAELIDGVEYSAKCFDENMKAPLRIKATNLILSLYLIVEGIELILAILEFPVQKKIQNFPNLLRVKRWANFLKHPKAFLLTHHPAFIFDGDKHDSDTKIISQDFIDLYYAGGKNNPKLYKDLQNKAGITVAFPNFEKLLCEFSDEIHLFVKTISENDNYRVSLGKLSTYEKFFEEYTLTETES